MRAHRRRSFSENFFSLFMEGFLGDKLKGLGGNNVYAEAIKKSLYWALDASGTNRWLAGNAIPWGLGMLFKIPK